MESDVDETGETVHARRRPIVMITSTTRRNFPTLSRCCFFHYIRFPDADTMRAIIAVHFPAIKQRLCPKP